MEKAKHTHPYLIITGPESTGKTELAAQLAGKLQCDWIPELSRAYISRLGRSYTFDDVVAIAQKQIVQFENYGKTHSPFVIFDTGLIITKVWFLVVFKQCPNWLLTAIEQLPKIPHLVCNTDLPWVSDSVRENGGEMREKLLTRYMHELEYYNFPFTLVSGQGEERVQQALQALQGYGLVR